MIYYCPACNHFRTKRILNTLPIARMIDFEVICAGYYASIQYTLDSLGAILKAPVL